MGSYWANGRDPRLSEYITRTVIVNATQSLSIQYSTQLQP